jgi:hypothetical protein
MPIAFVFNIYFLLRCLEARASVVCCYYATSRKAAGSVPDEVIELFAVCVSHPDTL